jgi:hypothetical protein
MVQITHRPGPRSQGQVPAARPRFCCCTLHRRRSPGATGGTSPPPASLAGLDPAVAQVEDGCYCTPTADLRAHPEPALQRHGRLFRENASPRKSRSPSPAQGPRAEQVGAAWAGDGSAASVFGGHRLGAGGRRASRRTRRSVTAGGRTDSWPSTSRTTPSATSSAPTSLSRRLLHQRRRRCSRTGTSTARRSSRLPRRSGGTTRSLFDLPVRSARARWPCTRRCRRCTALLAQPSPNG